MYIQTLAVPRFWHFPIIDMILSNLTSFFSIKIDSNTQKLYIIWKLMKQRLILLKENLNFVIILSRDHGHVSSHFP